MISRARIIQIGLAMLAFVLSVLMIYATGRDYDGFADTIDYIVAARMLVENGSYPATGGLNFFRAPLFPMFMALIWSVTGESVFVVKIVQETWDREHQGGLDRPPSALATGAVTGPSVGEIIAPPLATPRGSRPRPRARGSLRATRTAAAGSG